DPIGEVECLLRAKNWEEAHATLVKFVAPQAIITRDYEMLINLLLAFCDVKHIPNWNLGGQVYADFLHLMDVEHPKARDERQEGTDEILARLLASLSTMLKARKNTSLIETVAVQEMSGVVAKAVVAGKGGRRIAHVGS